MPYIDKSGNVVDKKPGWNLGNGGGIVGFFASIFAFLIIFLKSLFGMDTEDRNEGRSSSSFRRSDGGGGYDRGPPGGGPGGGGRRRFGRLPKSSDMSCAPMPGGG